MKPKLTHQVYEHKNLEGGIPYLIHPDGKVTLNRDAMEIQSYRYRIKNLKLQTIRIILSSVSILIAIAIFVYWITRG